MKIIYTILDTGTEQHDSDWHATRAQAEHYCAKLNAASPDHGRYTVAELTETDVARIYAVG